MTMGNHPSRSRAADLRAVERLIAAAEKWAEASKECGYAVGLGLRDTDAGVALQDAGMEFKQAAFAALLRFRAKPARVAPEDA